MTISLKILLIQALPWVLIIASFTYMTIQRYATDDPRSQQTKGTGSKNKHDPLPCSLYLKDRQINAFECPNCTSQWNQDEIIRTIFQTIGTTNRHCVEFGFGYSNSEDLIYDDFHSKKNTMTGLNTHALVLQGWTPTFFDAEFENRRIRLYKNVLTPENIGQAFQQAGVPFDVDYVSIDVDSIDVWLFHGMLLSGYRPRAMSVEYNANFPVDMLLARERDWKPWKHSSRIYGSSASSINLVAEMFGYQVVEIMPYMDMFFVKKEILEQVCQDSSLASFEFLAKGFVGMPVHETCSIEEAQSLVDFPLALQGLEFQAKKKAMEQVKELNERFLKYYGQPFCSL